MKDLLVYTKKIQGILFKRGKNGNSQRGGMLNTKKGSKAETIVIPDESACSGRDPVSRNEWFCWILRRRRTARLLEWRAW